MTETGIRKLLNVMASLRDSEHGCPWDLEQTHDSLVPYLIEEAYEVVESIESDGGRGLVDELGDILFQVVFHARIAEEQGRFSFDDVVDAICDKLIRRHPHVFAGWRVLSADQQSRQWEAHKSAERSATGRVSDQGSLLAGVPRALPAMTRGIKLQQRAAHAGFDWTAVDQVLAKVDEELAELREAFDAGEPEDRVEHEIGDLLQAVTNLARHVNVDPESALRKANGRFEKRFAFIEAQARRTGGTVSSMSLPEMEALWQQAKEKGY